MMDNDPVVIASAIRTPIGNFLGSLKDIPATTLGGIVINAVVTRAGVSLDTPQAVIMGCVLPAGLGQAPARQAALAAGLPTSVDCTTINKVCGSGMKATMLAHDLIKVGTHDVVVAGGMESMSNAPYLLTKTRAGYRMGHQQLIDHMLFDGLEDAYQKGKSMGIFAESCATHYKFSRGQQDDFALQSLERSREATRENIFANEIVPVSFIDKKGNEVVINEDDGPKSADPLKIPKLKPAFSESGTVTAANASSISDGAAALLLMKQTKAVELGVTPLAKIIGHATHSQEPDWFTTAPIAAIEKLLQKIGWDISEVDLFEINEAFAVVGMAAMQDLKIPHNKLNVHGGACVLGHPIGASGARIIVTLLNALQTKGLKKGIAALCIGGGEATAIAVELLD